MLDLGVVVHQMRTGELDGSKIQFVAERRAVALVKEINGGSGAVETASAEVPPGVEPSRENAVAAIQQALLAQVMAEHGDAKGESKAGGDEPPSLT